MNYTIWLNQSAFAGILNETGKKLPLETGGVLMGYWGTKTEAVITQVIGPGPKAIHKQFSFTPDHTYQLQQIAQLYAASGCIETYLGDWHVHPSASAYLSGTDLQTINRIASYKKARQPNPIMMILGTAPFGLKAWICQVRKMGFRNRSNIMDTQIRLY